MASNLVLTAVKDHRVMNGFANYFRMNNHDWWGTRRWLIQLVVWVLIVNGPWVLSSLPSPAGSGSLSPEKVLETLMMFFVMGGMFSAIGVVILGQNVIIQGRQNGTIAWVLSKPVSRSAFILSKFAADSLGILLTMVLIQGLISYLVCRFALGMPIRVIGFLGAMGLFYLHLLFYLALAYMLSSLLRRRGAVLGIPLVFIFTYQMHASLGWFGKILPWNLIMGTPADMNSSLAALTALQLPLPTVIPIIGTIVLTLAFILVTLWRFNREEF